MLKLSGAVFIIAALSLWGFSKSQSLKQRSENLARICSALSLLENEIAYGQKSIKDALFSVGTAENLPFFTSVSEKIGHCSVHQAFSEVLSEDSIYLSMSDKPPLLEFSQNLGSLDAASQIKSIIHTKELLLLAQTEAYGEYKKYGRLYRSMGLLLGILFSIILF